ncbi:MAG: hypothetical protein ACLFTK_11230 [Anaerolineales bacterium]
MQRIFLTLVVMALFIPASSLLAQPPDSPDYTTFTSQRGLYSVEYPQSWRVVVPNGSRSLVVTDMEESALLSFFINDELSADDYVLYAEPFSPELFAFAVEEDITPETTPEDLLRLASSIFFPTDSEAVSDEVYELGETQIIERADGIPMAVATLSNSQVNGWLILFRTADDVIVIARALTGPDSEFEPYETVTREMLDTLQIDPQVIAALEGDGDDGTSDSTQEMTPTPDPVDTDGADDDAPPPVATEDAD